MKRGGPLRRKPRISPISGQAQAFADELDDMRPLVAARAGHMCEVRLDGCEYRIAHVHHKLRRSQGGTNAMTNLLGVCCECHARIHAHPEWAYAHGWLMKRS